MNVLRAATVLAAAALFPVLATAQGAAKPGPEINKFAALTLGTWSYEGVVKDNPYGPPGRVIGSDVFEPGPGRFSITHRWDEENPLGHVNGLEVIAWDAAKKTLVGSYFSSVGEVGSGTLSVAGNVYTYSTTGVTWQGKNAWSTCTWTFSANATTLKVSCDASSDGKTWMKGVFTGTWTKK